MSCMRLLRDKYCMGGKKLVFFNGFFRCKYSSMVLGKVPASLFGLSRVTSFFFLFFFFTLFFGWILMNIHKRLNFVVKRGEDEVYDKGKKEDVMSYLRCLSCVYVVAVPSKRILR